MNKKINLMKLTVITGGPGVGKTTLLNSLENKGFKVVPEDARQIIKEQIQINGEGLPWKDKAYYSQLMLEASLKSYQDIIEEKLLEIVFFDRGILDTICYMDMENLPVSKELIEEIKLYPYNKRVFILPPWEDIYETDNERKQSWNEAVYTFEKMKQTYLQYGYEVIEVPKANVDERSDFLLSHI